MSDAGATYPALLRRRLDRELPAAVAGDGCWLVAADGRRWLDASGGAIVANLGHGPRFLDEVGAAMAEAASAVGYVNGTQFTNPWAERLAEALVPHLPGALRHSYFLSSGSEAVEAAAKLARQVQLDRGESGRWKVISLDPSYHGNTLGALALSGRDSARAPFAPMLVDFPRIPGPDPYRHPDEIEHAADRLEEEILRQGAGTVAAFLAETVGGSSTGARVTPPGYFSRVREICDRHGVLWIADEVMCGMGRTGRWFACERVGAVPDLMVLGKGLAAGCAPLAAVVASSEIVSTVARARGGFVHAQTYTHLPASTAAGLATVAILERERLVERAGALGPRLFVALEPLREHPWVGDVRGVGLLAGVELVADRATKRPFPRAARIAERVTAAAFARGLVVWPNTGHVAGEGDLLMLGPPFLVTAAELDEIALRLRKALDDIATEVEA
ncbi:MAG: hypothetical protein AMXMBFR36_05810 [Acidobacteriota bacterium]